MPVAAALLAILSLALPEVAVNATGDLRIPDGRVQSRQGDVESITRGIADLDAAMWAVENGSLVPR